MQGVSTRLGRYWKRTVLGYERIDSSSARRPINRVQMGSTENIASASITKRRFWRIKIKPKFSFTVKKLFSPKKLLIRLRDAYVNMMLGVAKSRVMTSGFRGYRGAEAFERTPLKENGDKMVLGIYKSWRGR